MSLSTSIASSRGGGPRKHTGSINNPICKAPQGSSSGRKQQSTNSEEEIAQRHTRSRNANKSTCCLISLITTTSLPVSATTLIVSAAFVCLSFVHEMAAT